VSLSRFGFVGLNCPGQPSHLALDALLDHGAIQVVAQERGQPCPRKAPATWQRADKAVRAPPEKMSGFRE
jgi:hypothetical protein